MGQLVSYIYTGKIKEDILVDHVEEFLELGEMYEMEALKTIAENKMMEILNTDNMIRFFVAGDLYRAERIRQKAKCFLKINLSTMKAKNNWKDEFGAKKELVVELVEDLI